MAMYAHVDSIWKFVGMQTSLMQDLYVDINPDFTHLEISKKKTSFE